MEARKRLLLLKGQGGVNVTSGFIFNALNSKNQMAFCPSIRCPHHLLQELIYWKQRPLAVKVRAPLDTSAPCPSPHPELAKQGEI